MSATSKHTHEEVVRVPFAWILLGIAAMLLFGILGGFMADQLFRPTLPPLNPDTNQLVTTVQQVTISPNKAIADIVEGAERSVLLIGRAETSQPTMLGTGFALTNDGLVVTSLDVPAGSYRAYDQEGRSLPLDLVGRDTLFGLTYFKLNDAVVTPLDIRQADNSAGQQLLALSRSQATYSARTLTYVIQEYVIPATAPAGWQRAMQGTTFSEPLLAGSPLLDEEGKVAGIMVNPTTGVALPVSHLQVSLQRATSNRREFNPLVDYGLTLQYAIKTLTPDQPAQFVATIQSVVPNAPAATAGLKAGDTIIAIQETPLDWQQSVVARLSERLPLQIVIRRDQQEQTVTLHAAIPSPLP